MLISPSTLHIITPLFRYNLLEKVYASIPKHEDIVWHIVKTSRRDSALSLLRTPHHFIDPRIRLYEIDVEDSDTVSKRNHVFEQIKTGYFINLDDDTEFCEAAYTCYQNYAAQKFVGLVIGSQLSKSGKLRLPANLPEVNFSIDTGNAICHHSVLEKVKWEWAPQGSRDTRDFIFWNNCYKYFGKAELVDYPISIYNSLSNWPQR